MLNRILIPLDGSPEMAAALPAVRQLVSGTGANVHLVLVRPVPRKPEQRGDRWVYLDELVREESCAGQAYLRHHGSALAYDGIVVAREVRFGDLLTETLAAADRQGAHLVALAPPALSSGRRLLRPSLVQQLMEKANMPVMVVPPGGLPARAISLRYTQVPV